MKCLPLAESLHSCLSWDLEFFPPIMENERKNLREGRRNESSRALEPVTHVSQVTLLAFSASESAGGSGMPSGSIPATTAKKEGLYSFQ